MKKNHPTQSFAAACGWVLAASLLSSQGALLVDIKTVAARGTSSSDSTVATRLYLDAGGTQAAPIGTPVWFVIDGNRDGLAAQGVGRSAIGASEMFGADDYVVLRDSVDGDQPGSVPGRFRRNGVTLNIPDGRTEADVLAGNVYAVLWNSPASTSVAEVGTSFGLLNLGVNAKPAIGNPFWSIDQDLLAALFTIAPVPEFESAAGCVAAGLLVWAGYRRFRR